MRRLVPLVALVALLAGCALVVRAKTYPKDQEITRVSWYRPVDVVEGRKSPPLEPADAVHPPIAAQALADAVAWAKERNSTGLLVLVDGRVATEWYADGFDKTSTTNSMSMAKTLVALLVGTAIDAGLIGSVDDPASKYLPELGHDKRREITLRHLLEMASGLRNDERLVRGSDLVNLYLGPHVEKTALSIPAQKLPGFTFDYNNVDSQLLGLVLERVTGDRYADVLSSRLWKPIGASDATVWLDRPHGTAHTFCCLFATVRDWGRVGQLLLDRGKVGPTTVVSERWLTQMLMPSKSNPDYGFQIWRADASPKSERAKDRKEPLLDGDMVWLDGRGDQKVYVLPNEKVVIVRVGEAAPEGTWDDSYLPNTIVRGLTKRP